MFLIFWRDEPIGWCKHAPKGCFLSFWTGGGWISHQVATQFPSNSSCSHQYPVKILLFSWSSKKIPIKFLLFLTITHQNPFVPIRFPSNSSCSFHMIKVLDICWRNWENRIIMSWRIRWKHSCFPKIIHTFCNSFKKSLISNFGSMDIWTMPWMSLLVLWRCMCFDFLWMR